MNSNLKQYEDKMNKTLDILAKDYAAIRAGRANPAVLDKVTVDYYGAPTPINQMAAVSVTEARTLTIQPWDRSTLKEIEKAINASDIGINPQNDGSVIPKQGEEAKVSVRNIRREAMDKLKAMKKAGELTEDDLKAAEKDTQDLTDKYCKQVDEMVARKTKEIMEI